jgi:DNA gyrase/topoisomerase IV subunit A
MADDNEENQDAGQDNAPENNEAQEQQPQQLPVTNTPLFAANENVAKINVADEIKNSFLDYSMSVIVSRALPDARVGLKP